MFDIKRFILPLVIIVQYSLYKKKNDLSRRLIKQKEKFDKLLIFMTLFLFNFSIVNVFRQTGNFIKYESNLFKTEKLMKHINTFQVGQFNDFII